MRYVGELYGRIGKKYFPMEKTADDIDAEIAQYKNRIHLTADQLFEIKTFHGIETVHKIIDDLIAEHVKTMKFPHPVCANNGEDTVYIHEDGTQTWNTIEKDKT